MRQPIFYNRTVNSSEIFSKTGDGMDVLYIVIPAYNEAENIERVIEEWYPVVEEHDGGGESRLVIINDGSRDNTLSIARSLEKDRPLLKVMNKKNGGHGDTVMAGYRYAIRSGADYVFQTDSDGQTLPEEFETFWRRRTWSDAIIGIRPVRGDGLSRKLVEKVLCFVLWIFFHVSLPDSNAPFRLMRTDALSELMVYLPRHYNLPNAVLTALFVCMKKRTEFIPITFRPRQGGVNSINIPRIAGIGVRALTDFGRISARVREQNKI